MSIKSQNKVFYPATQINSSSEISDSSIGFVLFLDLHDVGIYSGPRNAVVMTSCRHSLKVVNAFLPCLKTVTRGVIEMTGN